MPPKRLSVAGSGAPGPASLKEAKAKKEKAVSRVAKSLQRILDGVSGESKAKVEKGKVDIERRTYNNIEASIICFPSRMVQ